MNNFKTKLVLKEMGEDIYINLHKSVLEDLGIAEVVKIDIDEVLNKKHDLEKIGELFNNALNLLAENQEIDPDKCIISESDYQKVFNDLNKSNIMHWTNKGPLQDTEQSFDVPGGYMVLLKGFKIDSGGV